MFRVAGIYARGGHAASRFVDLMLDAADERGRQKMKVLAFPAERPIVAAVVAAEGNPPVQWASRADGSFAILDGELYNTAELQATVGANGTNEAETLLALYRASGREAMTRVQGAMCLVVWDAQQETLYVYRDRRGIVPSFFAELPEGVAWASDVWSLLRAGASGEVHRPALDFFLGNGFVPSPWTFAEGVSKIPPAHVLCSTNGNGARLQRYWQPSIRPRLNLSADEVIERLGELFEQSLRRRWSHDEKTGVLLSGGVDSKLIVAGLAKWLGGAPDTFTFQYTDYEGGWNEGEEARRAAQHFGTRHQELVFRPSDVADNLAWMVKSYGEPFTYGLHSCMLQGVVKAGVSVLHSGAGTSYPYLVEKDRYGLRYARLPSLLQRFGEDTLVPILRRLNAMASPLWLWRVYQAAGSLADELEAVMWVGRTRRPVSFSGIILPEAYRPAFYNDPSWSIDARRAATELFDAARSEYDEASDRDKFVLLAFHFRAPESTLYWNHWWGRAHGLSFRFPYCDDDLLDFMLRLPRDGQKKEEIRELAATLMPREMAYVPKVFQTVPIRHWIRGPLRDFLCDRLSPERIKTSGLFNNDVVQACVKQHLQGENDHAWKLWAMLTTLTWQDHAQTYSQPLKRRVPIRRQPKGGHVPGTKRGQASA